jgi:6,7-dimethyl-8-ribityllumazine synthase
VKVIEGSFVPAEGTYAIIAARVNGSITQALVAAAADCLRRHGVADASITVAWVPGSFELPLVAARLAKQSGVAAVMCLGAIIQGETDHHVHLAAAAASGIERAAADAGKPITFGVVTAGNGEQALARAGLKKNLGWDAAMAALETADLLRQIDTA